METNQNEIPCTVLCVDNVTEQPAVLPPAEPTSLERMEARLLELEDEARAAHARVYRMKAAIATLRGDCFHARWDSALASGDNATANACYLESQARRVLAGEEPYGDVSEKVKAEILATAERLKATKG